MYKLFLTLRFLTRKKIVVFPILVVWLCLMMMIIVTSIMGGFVTRVREANRDLEGDIIIYNDAGSGWAYYDELQDALKKQFSDKIAATTPVVRGYGLMNLPDFNQTFFAQITGIDPKTRSEVSRFRQTLFRQYISPENTVQDLTPRLPATTEELQAYARQRADAAEQQETQAYHQFNSLYSDLTSDTPPTEHPWPNFWWLLGLPVLALIVFLRRRRRGRPPRSVLHGFFTVLILLGGLAVLSLGFCWPVMFPRTFILTEDAVERATNDANRARITYNTALAKLPPGGKFTAPDQLAAILVPKIPSFAVPPTAVPPGADPDDAPDGCIVGIQFPLFSRDKRGNFDRSLDTGDMPALLTIVPISGRGSIETRNVNSARFVIVDDSYTGVYDVDSTYVYAPFEKVQYMAGMRTDKPQTDPEWFPPRCNEVLVRLKPGTPANDTRLIRKQMDDFVQDFVTHHPGMTRPGLGLKVQTWDEKQARYIGAVQNEKTMITVILGLMSLVVLVVIFLIFYMIVLEKTRDIGIIKAVGGSTSGVALIFLNYGLCVGLVGGVLGVISGVLFVTHTNQIHEWIYHMTGHMIWDRSVYLFDRIPDEYNPWEVLMYFLLALVAGVVGALIPAWVAALEDPVKAVRYE
ncbi:MAG TPA: FtsX-like permease family protein [Phycisphaerae bacterium]|nr:FtsX-like permease family protein [Phycisphaerae bacterium]